MSDLKIKLFSILNSIGPSMSAQQSEDISEAFNELDRLRAEVASLKEQNALLVAHGQEGWKLVPVEPTADMIIAAGDGYDTGEVIGPASCYRVMLAAAPPLPQQVKSEDARDAARYRWLRADVDGRAEIAAELIQFNANTFLDAEIDAAISAQEEKA